MWLATNKNRTCGLLNASKACLLQNNAGRCFFYGKLFPSPLKFASQLFGVPRKFLLNGNPETAKYIFAKTKEKGVKIPFFFWSEFIEYSQSSCYITPPSSKKSRAFALLFFWSEFIEYSQGSCYVTPPSTKKSRAFALLFFGRSDKNRTCGLLNPIQARYQTAPHPDILEEEGNLPPLFSLYIIATFVAVV